MRGRCSGGPLGPSEKVRHVCGGRRNSGSSTKESPGSVKWVIGLFPQLLRPGDAGRAGAGTIECGRSIRLKCGPLRKGKWSSSDGPDRAQLGDLHSGLGGRAAPV